MIFAMLIRINPTTITKKNLQAQSFNKTEFYFSLKFQLVTLNFTGLKFLGSFYCFQFLLANQPALAEFISSLWYFVEGIKLEQVYAVSLTPITSPGTGDM